MIKQFAIRMEALLPLGASFFFILNSSTASQGPTWVPEAVRSPDGRSSTELVIWEWPHSLGDLDEDGRMDTINLITYAESGGYTTESRLEGQLSSNFDFFLDRLFQRGINLGPPSWSNPAYHWFISALNTPNGPQLVIDHPDQSIFLSAFNYHGDFLMEIPIPQSQPPLPPITSIGFHVNVGDVNGDGWEDLGASFKGYHPTGDHVYFGILSGLDFEPIWLNEVGDPYNRSLVRDYGLTSRPDIDQDGFPDFFGSIEENGISSILAWSGKNGQQLWRHNETLHSHVDYWYVSIGEDVNDDGISELIIISGQIYIAGIPADPGLVRLLDGSTGIPIWTSNISDMDPAYNNPNSQHGAFLVGYPAIISDITGDLSPDVVFPSYHYTIGTDQGTPKMAVFSGVDGAFVELEDYPPDLQPWNFDTLVGPRMSDHSFIGDLNGDGYPEVQIEIHAPNYSLTGFADSWTHFVTLSRRTLDLPAQAQIGGQVLAGIDLPTAAHETVRLLTSTSFDANLGAHKDGFRTLLGSGQLFSTTSQSSALVSTLDAFGKGSITFGIPNQPWLANRTIFLRAIAADSSRPGHIRTMTTLASLMVLP